MSPRGRHALPLFAALLAVPFGVFAQSVVDLGATLAGRTLASHYALRAATLASSLGAATSSAPRWPSAERPRTVATPFRGVVALALVDLDGDRHDELAIVTAERVQVARFTDASLTFLPATPSTQLPRAVTPLRQPFGSADVDPSRHTLRYRTSHHAAMVELSLADGALQPRTLPFDLYPARGFGCVALRPGSDMVTSIVPTCDATAPARVDGAVSAVPVAYEHTARDGTRHRWEVRADGAGHASVLRDGAIVSTLDDVAAPLVVDDLDGDGALELVTASASAPGAPDRARVFTLAERAEASTEVRVPGPIEAMASGDLDGDGRRELVVSVQQPARRGSTLWIIR